MWLNPSAGRNVDRALVSEVVRQSKVLVRCERRFLLRNALRVVDPSVITARESLMCLVVPPALTYSWCSSILATMLLDLVATQGVIKYEHKNSSH